MVSSDWTTRGSSDLLQNWTHQLTSNMIGFYSFHFIMQGKLIILRTRCFLHQNISQLPWFKEKTLLQSKFCRTLKSNISKVSKRGVLSVLRLQKKREGTEQSLQHPNQPPLKKRHMRWFWCEVDCRRGRWQSIYNHREDAEEPDESPKPRFHWISF